MVLSDKTVVAPISIYVFYASKLTMMIKMPLTNIHVNSIISEGVKNVIIVRNMNSVDNKAR